MEEKKVNSKTTKAELMAFLNDDKCVITKLEADVEELKKANAQLTKKLSDADDVIYNLRLYLNEVKRTDKKLWEKLVEKFEGMPGFIAIRAAKKVRVKK